MSRPPPGRGRRQLDARLRPAAKLLVPIAHVEAGLRSGNRTMPEEINRILTDALSDLCFTTCDEANENVAREGVPAGKVFLVGNVMIDTLLAHRGHARRCPVADALRLAARGYGILTLHRTANVDRLVDAVAVLDAGRWPSGRVPPLWDGHAADRIVGVVLRGWVPPRHAALIS